MLETITSIKDIQFFNFVPRFLRRFNNTTITLKDGTAVYFRQISSVDATSIFEIYDNMSDDSLYLRFNGSVSARVYKQMAEKTAVSIEENGFGMLAYVLDDNRESGIRPLGLAYYVGCGNLPPEFALSIVDAFQNKGLGKNLLNLLFTRAQKAGLAFLEAYVLSCNSSMKMLIHRSGKVFYTGRDGSYDTYRILV